MRIFAVSDVHVDYDVNRKWIANLSTVDYQDDLLILAGDVTDILSLLEWCLTTLAARFNQVLFVPGNHDLWVLREDREKNSLEKFDEVRALVSAAGASMDPYRTPGLSILPLLSWYDYSFGEPAEELKQLWMDYRACRWPDGWTVNEIAAHFASLNSEEQSPAGDTVITYSHFMPRIDLMPHYIPPAGQLLYPVLGSDRIERQLRQLGSQIHVYGHSHVNRGVTIDGVTYINSAFGYPNETLISAKRLTCIHDC